MNSNTTPPPPYSATSRTSGLAIASLVLGILSFGFWIVTGLPAVICGHLSLSKIKKASGTMGGRELAIAGLITGYIGLAVGTLIIGVLLAAAIYNLDVAKGIAKGTRTKADIQMIRTSLLAYNGMNGFYPTTEQGLSAMVMRPGSEPAPTSWRRLMEEVPKDAWGMPYIYRCPGRKNPSGYDVFSSGPDRIPDTADDDYGK
jgi:general secretion pathway protein G